MNSDTKKPKLINIIGGPGVGKTLITSLLYARLKIMKKKIEWVPEDVKTYVWKKEFDILNNQYFISHNQYLKLKSLGDHVDYMITDGSLLHGLYHNKYNPKNNSNIELTEKDIIKWYNEFDNINIFLEKGQYDYETYGRTESEEQSIEIGKTMKKIFTDIGVKFVALTSDILNIDAMIGYII